MMYLLKLAKTKSQSKKGKAKFLRVKESEKGKQIKMEKGKKGLKKKQV